MEMENSYVDSSSKSWMYYYSPKINESDSLSPYVISKMLSHYGNKIVNESKFRPVEWKVTKSVEVLYAMKI